MLEVTAYAGGAFRLRLGPNTRPDYGLLVGRAQRVHDVAAGAAAVDVRQRRRDARARRRAAALPPAVEGRAGAHVDHRRALPRLDAPARRSAARRAAGCGPRRSRSRRASPCTASARSSARSTSAASSSTRRSRTRSASTPGSSYKNTPFAWSPGTGSGAWGVFVHTPGMVTHGVGHPDWSHRSYAVVVDDEALDLVPVRRATRPPASSTPTRSSPAARRRCRAGASGCGCRARTTRRRSEAIDVAREAARAAHSLRRADARRPRRVEHARRASTSNGTPTAFPIRRPRSPRSARTTCAVCVWEYPYVSVHSRAVPRARAARLPADARANGDPYVFGWDTTPAHEPVRRRADAAARKRHRRLHAIPTRTRGGAMRTSALFADGVDVIKSDFGEHVPDDAVALQRRLGPAPAQRLSAALQPVRLRGDARSSSAQDDGAADRVEPRRLDGQPALSDRLGRRSAKRLGRARRVDPRRLVVGHERQSVPQLRHRRLLRRRSSRRRSSTCAGCRRRCSARTCACTASASASPGRSAPRPRRSAASGSRSAIG